MALPAAKLLERKLKSKKKLPFNQPKLQPFGLVTSIFSFFLHLVNFFL
jgi:hypothetical protein